MDTINIIGWDIGGANIKATRICFNTKNSSVSQIDSLSRFFPMWDENQNPLEIVKEMYSKLGESCCFGVTMTAELADRFQRKNEGINFIINLFENNFPDKMIYYYDYHGSPSQLKDLENLEKLAAANWAVSSLFAAEFLDNFVLFDIGSTTTDIIPVINGTLNTAGFTDTDRLYSGELLYLGFLRSNLASFIERLPFKGKMIEVMNEYFANTADLHILEDLIEETEYSIPTPDNGGKDLQAAATRIARLISQDLDSADFKQVKLAADYIFQREIDIIYEKLIQVYSRVDPLLNLPLFANNNAVKIAEQLKKRADFKFIPLEDEIEILKDNILTSTAAAYLLCVKINNNK